MSYVTQQILFSISADSKHLIQERKVQSVFGQMLRPVPWGKYWRKSIKQSPVTFFVMHVHALKSVPLFVCCSCAIHVLTQTILFILVCCNVT